MAHPAPASAQPQTQPSGLWSFRFVEAMLPDFKGGGLPWDSDGTLPDPFVRLIIDGRTIWESPVQQNTRNPHWNVTLPRSVYVPSGANFRIELWDEDPAGSDPAGVLIRAGLPETARPDALARLTMDNMSVVSVVVSEPRAYKGVGIDFEQRSDALYVIGVEAFSPAARAGIKTGESIVAVGPQRVEAVGSARAASDLSLSAERGGTLTVRDKKGQEREAILDSDFLWLVM
jgi:hypothetical protein